MSYDGFTGPIRNFFGWHKPSYEAASRTSPQLGTYIPILKSPDAELPRDERDLVVARQRDSIRNNPIGAGYIRGQVDGVIGTGLMLLPRPNYIALGQTPEWADLWQRIVKSLWQQYAEDEDCYIHIERKLNFAGLLQQMYRSFLFNAEIICVLEWRKVRGNAFARTAVNVIHADLLCNPNNAPDTDVLRSGVALDPETREPVGYWFRQAHTFDTSSDSPLKAQTWKYVPAYTPWGRKQVLHVFDMEQAGQTRGRPTFAAALLEMRCLQRFERTALEAQIVQAMYAAVIESNADPKVIGAAMGRGDSGSPLSAYTQAQADFAGEGGVVLGGTKVPHLLMGESLEFKTPGNSAPTLDAFVYNTKLNLSRALPGVSYEEISGDYSKTSYASARASGIAPWRFITGQRKMIAQPIAQGIYSAVLEEWINDGRVVLPDGVDFYVSKTAIARSRWIGAARGHIDDLKAEQANELRRQMGTLTHEDHCAEDSLDSDEVIDRLKLEKQKFDAAGLQIIFQNVSASPAIAPTKPPSDTKVGGGGQQG